MEMQYFKEYSPALGREMECKVYGHGGRPMLYIPCQDGRFFDFEDFHMADTLAPWIESGQLMVMSIDTLDKETWSDTNGDPYWRIRRYEQWLHYIVDEAVPKLRYLSKERNGWDDLPGVIAFGCSLGATHAVNLYLRRLYHGVIKADFLNETAIPGISGIRHNYTIERCLLCAHAAQSDFYCHFCYLRKNK